MTKRIEELAKQAFDTVDPDDKEWFRSYSTKFAELVMAECAEACTDEQCNTLCSPKELIDMHFGI